MDPSGNAILAWGRNNPGGGLVRAMRYIAGSGWDAPNNVALYVDPNADSAPMVAAAMGPTGQGVVSYVVRRGGARDQIHVNTLR
jgi:hypothetical protein